MMIGTRFTRLVIVASAPSPAHWKKKIARWLCRCDCGAEKVISQCHLVTGATQSCGCLGRERRLAALTTHGMSKTTTFRIWASMLDRCLNPNAPQYADYGGRGIKVCDRWRESFANFLADMGERPGDLTLDRLNNDSGYEPGNCAWRTRKAQGTNTRRNVFVQLNGERLTVSDASKRLGMSASAVSHRARRTSTSHQDAVDWFVAMTGFGGSGNLSTTPTAGNA